jgi:hypothetical protein
MFVSRTAFMMATALCRLCNEGITTRRCFGRRRPYETRKWSGRPLLVGLTENEIAERMRSAIEAPAGSRPEATPKARGKNAAK